MATGEQVEQLKGLLGRDTPANARATVVKGFVGVSGGLTALKQTRDLAQVVATDAAAAGKNDYGIEQTLNDWTANLVSRFNTWTHGGKTGIKALAQLIADLSEQAGLEGGANELRLYRNGAVIPVDQDA